MSLFDSSNCYKSVTSSEALEKKFLKTEKYLIAKPDFIGFQDWSLESEAVVIGDENGFDDEDLSDELAQLFSTDEVFDDEQLADELASLEEYLMETKTVLVACPKNMPRWENAWWGERVLSKIA